MLKKIFLISIIIFVFGSCSKVEDFFNGDYELWKERVAPIVEGCVTDYEKAKAIYEWECANIAYDVSLSIYHASECWEQKKGVCNAYSDLFVKLASGCDLEAVLLSGKARTSDNLDGEAGHAWVKVHTEKGWMLCDPTWGAGCVGEGEFFPNEYNMAMSWFDADPEIVVFTHFPPNRADQFLDVPLTEYQYKQLPDLSAAVVPAGWKANELLNYFLNNPGKTGPLFYSTFYDSLGKFELVQVPFNGEMKVGQTYTLKIRSLDEGISIGSWETNQYLTGWEQEGDLFSFAYTPETECEFFIALGLQGLMKYDVRN